MRGFLVSTYLRDNLRTRNLILWTLLAAACGGIGYMILSISGNPVAEENYAVVSGGIAFRVVALVCSSCASAIIAQDVEQKTIVQLLTTPVPRLFIVISRYLAAVVAATVISWIILTGVALGTLGGNAFGSAIFHRDLIASALACTAYVGLFLMLSLMLNRATIFSLLYAFGWEFMIPNLPGDLYRTSIYSYAQAIAQHPKAAKEGAEFFTGALGQINLTQSQGVFWLLAIAACTLAISMYWFTHFEYLPREDAE